MYRWKYVKNGKRNSCIISYTTTFFSKIAPAALILNVQFRIFHSDIAAKKWSRTIIVFLIENSLLKRSLRNPSNSKLVLYSIRVRLRNEHKPQDTRFYLYPSKNDTPDQRLKRERIDKWCLNHMKGIDYWER